MDSTHDNQHTEHEIVRLRREHAAMKAFIQRIANRDKQDYMASPISMQILIDDARTLLAIYADTAIASSAPSPEGGNAGARYVVVYEPQSYDGVLHDARFYVFDTDTDKAVDDGGYLTYHAAQAEAARLNAAHPASGTATVAGSGNGGE